MCSICVKDSKHWVTRGSGKHAGVKQYRMGAGPVSIAALLFLGLAHAIVDVAVRLQTLVVSVACRPKVSQGLALHRANGFSICGMQC